MFQKLLEKILQKILGEYLEGFDSKNFSVGLWSGDVVIQNVRIKKSVLLALGLPLELQYSYIQTLKLKIPWKSLTSSKIEIQLEGLYIIISQIPQQKWDLKDSRIIQKRKKQIISLTENILKKFNQRQVQKITDNQESKFEKLIYKIIDNLQIQIKDIHIAFQDSGNQGFGFGITLEKFKINTVNRQGVEEYIDRTKPEYKHQPLRKKLQLKNFGFYWNQKSQILHKKYDIDQIKNILKSKIEKATNFTNNNYLILLNSNAKLFQREKDQFSEPYITLEVQFKKIKIDLKNRVLQQIINLSQQFQKFTYNVKKKQKVVLSQAQQENYKKIFKQLYHKYYEKELKFEDPKDQKAYDKILEKMEVQKLKQIIKNQIKQRQKLKMITKKQTKKIGWFTYGKKELDQKQLNQVQEFLNKNFSDEVKIIKRPKSYFFMQVKLVLQELQFVISNRFNTHTQGISLRLFNLNSGILLREEGYNVTFNLSNLKVDLLKINNQTKQIDELINFFTKKSRLKQENYIDLSLVGNPINRQYIDTQLKLNIKPAIITFNPVILTIISDFTNLKINQSNKDSAMEKFGQIKDKTSESLNKTLEDKNVKILSIDINISAPLIILPFQPNSKQYCWGLDMGQLRIYTKQDMLKSDIKKQLISKQKYGIQLSQLQLSWFNNRQSILNYIYQNDKEVEMDTVINDIRLLLDIQLQKNNKSQKNPNILIKGVVNQLNMNLSKFSYNKITQIGLCFQTTDRSIQQLYKQQQSKSTKQIKHQKSQKEQVIEGNEKKQKQKKQKVQIPVQEAISQKKEIMNKSQKLGFIHKRNNMSKMWKKYISVLQGNYIYFYADKKSQNYDQYIYVRNSIISIQKQQECGKLNSIRINNKISKDIILAFDKTQAKDQWMKLIAEKKDEQIQEDYDLDIYDQKKQQKVVEKKINYNQLKIQLVFEITSINLHLYDLKIEQSWLNIEISKLDVILNMYQSKINLHLSLNSLSLMDKIQKYSREQWNYFLKSDNTKSQTSRLIQIQIIQISEKDPSYKNTDNQIKIIFGVLYCNLKPEVVSKTLKFFTENNDIVIKKEKKIKIKKEQIIQINETKDYSFLLSVVNSLIALSLPKKIFVDLKVQIQEITLNIININTKVKQYTLSLRNFLIQIEKSNQNMIVKGGLNSFTVSDNSNYPNTIVDESEYIDNQFLLLKSISQKGQKLLDFQIIFLNNTDKNGNDLIVNIVINKIKIDYYQQLVLRLLDNLLLQILPSLSSTNDNQRMRQKVKIQAPQKATMSININIKKIDLIIRPQIKSNQMLNLNIDQITIKNSSYETDFTKSGNKSVIVSNYTIVLKKLIIATHQRELTNDFNFQLIVELISSPDYYKIYQGQDFLPGMRINCNLTPFLMRINNMDYKFVMKCLFGNITYDDNCDEFLYKQKYQLKQIIQKKSVQIEQQVDPIYFKLNISMLTLVVTEKILPISNLSINKMNVGFTRKATGMTVTVAINDLSGSYFSREEEKYKEKNMIKYNLVNNLKTYNENELIQLQQLVKLFYKQNNLNQGNQKNDLELIFDMKNNGDKNIEIILESLFLNLELGALLKLSHLAQLDSSVQPPPPAKKKSVTKQNRKSEKPKNQYVPMMKLKINLKNFKLTSLNQILNQQIGIEGQVFIFMESKPELNKQQLIKLEKRFAQKEQIQNGKMTLSINDLSIYLGQKQGNILKKKRRLLNPLNFIIVGKTIYSNVEKKIYMTNEYVIKVEYLKLDVTIKDMIKLNNFYLYNMNIIKQQQKETQNVVKPIKAVQTEENNLENIAIVKKLVTDEVIKDMRAQININHIELIIVNDCNKLFIPVIRLEISETNPVLKSNPLLSRISLVTYLSLNFYNPRTSTWEPIIERCSFIIEYLSVIKQIKNQTRIILQNNDQEGLNLFYINLSTQFLTSLSQTLTFANQLNQNEKKKIQQLSKIKKANIIKSQTSIEEDQIQISPYILENLTWQQIQIEVKIDMEAILAKKTLRSNQIQILQKIKNKHKKLASRTKGQIFIPKETNQIILNIKGSSQVININKFGKSRIPKTEFFMDCTVQKLNRFLQFTGNKVIANKMNKRIFVRIDERETFQLLKGAQLPLQGVNYIRIGNDPNNLSQEIHLKNLPELSEITNKQKKNFYNLIRKTRMINNIQSTMLQIHVPFIFINNLPKPLLFQLIVKKKTNLTQQLKSQNEFEINRHGKRQEINIKINIQGYFWTQQISIAQNIDKQIDIALKDAKNQCIVIKALITKRIYSETIQVNFYTIGYILNETPFQIMIYGHEIGQQKKKNKNFHVIGGQDKVEEKQQLDNTTILLGAQIGSILKFKDRHSMNYSEQVSIGGIGSSDIEIQTYKNFKGVPRKIFATIGVNINIKQMDKQTLTLSKQIRITPRYILYNHCKQRIYINQHKISELFALEPEQREIFFYLNNYPQNKKITFKTENSKESSPISFSGLGVSNFYVEQNNKKRYLKFDIRIAQDFIVGVLQDVKSSQIPYRVQNKSGLKVIVPQIQNQQIDNFVDFSWKSPEQAHQITIQFINEQGLIGQYLKVNPDIVNYQKNITLKYHGQNIKIHVFITIQDQKKIVKIQQKKVEQTIIDNVLSTINIKIKNIGISIVLNHNSIMIPYQAFFFTFKNLEFIHKSTELFDDLQLKLQFSQLDQNYPYILLSPVIFTPQKFKNFFADDSKYNLINLHVQRDKKSLKSLILKKIHIQLSPITIRITELFIKLIFDLIKQSAQIRQIKQEQYLIQKYKNQWLNVKIPQYSHPIYIEEIKIAPLAIQLTAQLKPQEKQRRFFLLQMFLKTFGVALANIEQAPLFLTGIHLMNCFDTPSGIKQKLFIHYKPIVLRQIYKIFGSLNIIGNPAGLFKNISTGLTDMVKKPAEGIVKGPLQLGQGIAEGAGSLVAHTIGGTFNSLGKISGAVSTGLTALCFDKDFQKLREKQKLKKPKNALQGLEKGTKAALTGIRQGVMGVFLKPYQGAKKDGFLGFVKGSAQGVTGLFIKPMTGLLDMSMKTSEGLKNSALHYEDKSCQTRLRYPRVFYGDNGQMKEYIILDAEIFNNLQWIKKSRFTYSKLFKAFLIEKEPINIFVVLNDFLVMLNAKKQIVWFLQIKNIIVPFKAVQGGFELTIKQSNIFLKNQTVLIETPNQQQQKEMIELIIDRIQSII